MDGAVKFNVSANTAQFDAAMSRVGSVAQTTGDRVRMAFSGLGSILAGGVIVSGIQNILRAMDDISDRAKRFGVTVEEIQRVGNAADIVGTNFETVARAMDRTGVSANKAAREGGSIAEAFARVNLDPAAFAAASLQERIEMIAKAQRAANGDAAKMAELFEVIGVRAAGINFAELSTEMGSVNAASAKTVEQLAKANDLLTKMKQNSTILGANLLRIAIFDPAEKIGSLLAGEGLGMTTEDVQEKYKRMSVRDDLAAKGQLILGQDGKPVEVPRFAPNTEATRKQMADAEENERRITEEIEKRQQELEAVRQAQLYSNDVEDVYGESVKENNAELVKRNRLLEKPTSGQDELIVNPTFYKPVSDTFDATMERVRSLERPNASMEDLFTAGRLRREALDTYQREMMDLRRPDNMIPANMADAMMRESALTEPERQRLQEQRNLDKPREATALATETTLQKAVAFLEELTGKLPQPVLV